MKEITEGILNLPVCFSFDDNNFFNEKVHSFVDKLSTKQQSVGYYVIKRKAVNEQRVRDNIFLGKKAELFVLEGMKQFFNLPYGKIDFAIRQGKEKGWQCDLVYPNYNIHVKCCDQRTFDYCQDYSWTFQLSAQYGTDELFKTTNNKDEYVVLVFVKEQIAEQAVIKAIMPIKKIIPLLRDPKKKELKNVKKCIYWKDIEKIYE